MPSRREFGETAGKLSLALSGLLERGERVLGWVTRLDGSLTDEQLLRVIETWREQYGFVGNNMLALKGQQPRLQQLLYHCRQCNRILSKHKDRVEALLAAESIPSSSDNTSLLGSYAQEMLPLEFNYLRLPSDGQNDIRLFLHNPNEFDGLLRLAFEGALDFLHQVAKESAKHGKGEKPRSVAAGKHSQAEQVRQWTLLCDDTQNAFTAMLRGGAGPEYKSHLDTLCNTDSHPQKRRR